MKLWEYQDKLVVITFKDGEKMTGMVEAYISELDNEGTDHKPGIASILFGEHYEIYEDEIESIELATRKIK